MALSSWEEKGLAYKMNGKFRLKNNAYFEKACVGLVPGLPSSWFLRCKTPAFIGGTEGSLQVKLVMSHLLLGWVKKRQEVQLMAEIFFSDIGYSSSCMVSRCF